MYFLETDDGSAIPIRLIDIDNWPAAVEKTQESWAKAVGYEPKFGQPLLIPGSGGIIESVLLPIGGDNLRWALASCARILSGGSFRLIDELDSDQATEAVLGWLLGQYAFDRYKEREKTEPNLLVIPAGADAAKAQTYDRAIRQVRDMVNTPAEEMGPEELAQAAVDLARETRGECRIIVGDELLTEGYPAVERVGRGSLRPPRLIDLTWPDGTGPSVVLIGKGVCFDSGGLDLKPPEYMLHMRNDMSGGAHALALARMLLDSGPKLKLRVMIPAVENMPSGNAYRPGDVIRTRSGKSVEITNTDAEGRVILADPLFEACKSKPDLIIDFATLTGAARVALGSDIPAVFSNRRDLAFELTEIGGRVGDPVWPLPLYQPYRKLMDSMSANIRNANTDSPMGGAITAALFLNEFVDPECDWLHLDIPGGLNKPEPGRAKGGEAFSLLALAALIGTRYGN